jgi:hypothetical protein
MKQMDTQTNAKWVCVPPKILIPFDCILFSGLHASIDIGGVFINNLEKFIDADMAHVLKEEFQLRKTKSSASIQISHLRAEKKEWNKSANGVSC